MAISSREDWPFLAAKISTFTISPTDLKYKQKECNSDTKYPLIYLTGGTGRISFGLLGTRFFLGLTYPSLFILFNPVVSTFCLDLR